MGRANPVLLTASFLGSSMCISFEKHSALGAAVEIGLVVNETAYAAEANHNTGLTALALSLYLLVVVI